jgi:F-type H+-transporting ATPase subunit delta
VTQHSADFQVARRYAEAFVNTLEAANRLEPGLEELKSVSAVYSSSRQFQRFLGSPEIAPEDKTRLLGQVCIDIGTETRALLDLLLRWDRIDQLPVVYTQAVKVAELRRGIYRGTVTTAHPVSSAEVERLSQAVGKAIGKKVILERQINPAVLGGAQIAIGTNLLDGSVSSRLKELSRQLKGTKID